MGIAPFTRVAKVRSRINARLSIQADAQVQYWSLAAERHQDYYTLRSW